MSNNYFNTLFLREQLEQLGKCRFMHLDEFTDGISALKGKKMVERFIEWCEFTPCGIDVMTDCFTLPTR